MHAVIFAGGNQTRFGDISQQSKVLYPLPNGHTVLSNIINQLQSSGVDSITIRTRSKESITNYIQSIKADYKISITIDDRDISQGDFVIQSPQFLPCMYVFGDTYYEQGTLKYFIDNVTLVKDKCDGVIGLTAAHVGDYRAKIENDCIKELSKESNSGLYTCGLFTFFNSKSFSELHTSENIYQIIDQLIEKEYQFWHVLLEQKMVDLDTPEMARLL